MPADTMSPTPAEPNVEEIRARADAATAGPWYIVLGSGTIQCTGIMGDENVRGEFVADCLPDYALKYGTAPADHVPNLNFIAHARTDIPVLLSSLAEARREISVRADLLMDCEGRRVAAVDELARIGADLHEAQAELRELRETALTREEAKVLVDNLRGFYTDTSPFGLAVASLRRIAAGTPEKADV